MIFWQHALPTLQMLRPEDCQTIHLASLEILRHTVAQVHHYDALHILGETDTVISDENWVRFPPGLFEWTLAQAPSMVILCRRGSSQPLVRMEGMHVSFGAGSDCPNYLDTHIRKQRLFRTPDIINCLRLVNALLHLDLCMSMGLPSDLDTSTLLLKAEIEYYLRLR